MDAVISSGVLRQISKPVIECYSYPGLVTDLILVVKSEQM